MDVTLFVISLWTAISLNSVNCREQWTEADEERRIEDIKRAERLQFQREQYGYGMRDYHQQTVSLQVSQKGGSIDTSFWCYHCASALDSVKSDNREAILQFLKIRRTTFPGDAMHEQCSAPTNVSLLARQFCRHKYCQTLILTDHSTASVFTIRGCAENFGAINEELLQRQGDHSCNRLHDKLDIQECVCREQQYCSHRNANSLALVHHLSVICFMISVLSAYMIL